MAGAFWSNHTKIYIIIIFYVSPVGGGGSNIRRRRNGHLQNCREKQRL
ncbi:uncharacterized protein G2W53_019090 [Senna tora]|uniref:Uncharacterized protein n=1 Tax=Senna tora TaxID=362788 RepID=A0A834TWC3_9FABA|nr:uncharacterized protein G2W53_019090 [Senna tora]